MSNNAPAVPDPVLEIIVWQIGWTRLPGSHLTSTPGLVLLGTEGWSGRRRLSRHLPPALWLRSVLGVQVEPLSSSLSPGQALELDLNRHLSGLPRPGTLTWERPEHHGYVWPRLCLSR